MRPSQYLLTLPGLILLLGLTVPHDAGKTAKKNRMPVYMQQAFLDAMPGEIIPGTILIKFKPGLAPFEKQRGPVTFGIPSLDAISARFEVKDLAKRFIHKPITAESGLPDLSRIYRISFPEYHDAGKVALAFSMDQNVEYAVPEYRHQIDAVPNDPMYPQQFHLPQIMAEEAWNIHKGQEGTETVVVAVIDVGVDWLHPDLRQNTWQNLGEDADNDGHTIEYSTQWGLDLGDINGIDDDLNGYVDDLVGWDFFEFELSGNGSDPDPYFNPMTETWKHGTHVAGITAAKTDNGMGVASISWNVKYMPVQSDRNNNTLFYGYDGIIYAAENGADVINCSWSGAAYSQAEADVVAYASGLGSILICSGGNTNANELRFPSGYPGVVAVAAVNYEDIKASYSTYGIAIDITAPGGDWDAGMLSTLPNNSYGGDLWFGTSMASPLAAGLAALIKSYHPDWTRDQVLMQLLSTCDDLDTQNPGYANCFGGGRINAYRALSESGGAPPQHLKISLQNFEAADIDTDGVIARGDTAAISMTLWNHAAFVGSDEATFNLSTTDPDIILLQSTYTGPIPADDLFEINDMFLFKVSESCPPHLAEFMMTIDADVPVVFGDSIPLKVLVAPDGIFVFEDEPGHYDYSGSYIRMFLEDIGQPVLYSDIYPNSFLGFDQVFLSCGNFGQLLTEGFYLDYERTLAFQEYLENGGMLYLEAGGLFMGSEYFAYPNAAELRDLFGVETFQTNMQENPIDHLAGIDGTPYEGIVFTNSTQAFNWYIDDLTASEGAYCTFYEDEYGNVGINSAGSYGQKTSYFSYALAELKDISPVSSRYNVLLKTMEFFGYLPEPGYVIANFTSDISCGGQGLAVQFTDLSLTDDGYTVSTWQWDFQNDGVIDSYEQNPQFTYLEAGTYDIRLIASNGSITDTMIYPDFIRINDGMLVIEKEEGLRDFSGGFIRDFLLANNYSVTYMTGSFPESFRGFDAVFLSMGNYGGQYMALSDGMTSILLDYLESGGKVYLESGDALGFDQADNDTLLAYFGLMAADDGSANGLNLLEGQISSVMEGIFFTGSNQVAQAFIDKYFPLNTDNIAFIESDYSNVAVQNTDQSSGSRTFCFSYALAELQDGDDPNTREEFLWRILEYFDLITGQDEYPSQRPPDCNIQIFPNPAMGGMELHLSFKLESPGPVQLELFSITGEKVAEPINRTCSSGNHQESFSIEGLPAGIYLGRLTADGVSYVARVVILK